MTPRDYVEPWELEELRRRMQSIPQWEGVFDDTRSEDEDWSDHLRERIVELLPAAARWTSLTPERLGDRLTLIRVDDEVQINGYVLSPDGGETFELRVHFGLVDFLYKMSILFAATVGLSRDGVRQTEPPIPAAQLRTKLLRLVGAFWDGTLIDERSVRMVDLADHQFDLSTWLYTWSNHFVAAHELAHVVLAVGPAHIEERSVGRALARRFHSSSGRWRRALGRAGLTPRGKVLDSWAEEIAADLLAVKLVVDGSDSNLEALMRWGVVDWLLAVQELIEAYAPRSVAGALPAATTHPSSSARRAALRYAMRANPPWVFQLGDAMAAWIEHHVHGAGHVGPRTDTAAS